MSNTNEIEKVDIHWDTDQELFQIVKEELYTAVVGDIMDDMGHFHPIFQR